MSVQIAKQKENISPKNRIERGSSKLSEIFERKKNISIWDRELSSSVIKASESIINTNPKLQFSKALKVEEVEKKLIYEFGSNSDFLYLFRDISKVVNMFCDLFKVNNAWLRLDAIDGPMCPRFHVDNVKCRLVTTYLGPGTQWLPNNTLNRDNLGHGNHGESDESSGLFLKNDDIQQLDAGHLALLKGETWPGNEGKGLVHRSPQKDSKYKRLYMTIDFVELYLKIYNNRLNISI